MSGVKTKIVKMKIPNTMIVENHFRVFEKKTLKKLILNGAKYHHQKWPEKDLVQLTFKYMLAKKT